MIVIQFPAAICLILLVLWNTAQLSDAQDSTILKPGVYTSPKVPGAMYSPHIPAHCRSLPNDVKEKIKNFFNQQSQSTSNGTTGSGLSGIMRSVDRVNRKCMKFLSKKISEKACEVDEFVDSVCQRPHDTEFMREMLRCLTVSQNKQQERICAAIRELKTNMSQCVSTEAQERFLTELLIKNQCSSDNIDVFSFINLPTNRIKDFAARVSKQQMLQWAIELVQNHDVLEMMDCRSVQAVMMLMHKKLKEGLDDIAFGEILSNNTLAPLLPYFPADECIEIPAKFIRDNLDILGQQPFKCRTKRKSVDEDDEYVEDCHSAAVASNSSAIWIPSTKPPPTSRSNKYMKVKKFFKTRNKRMKKKKCKWSCGFQIAKQLNLKDAAVRTNLNSLLPCAMSADTLLATASPGSCADLPSMKINKKKQRKILSQCLPQGKTSSQYTKTDLVGLGCLLTQLPKKGRDNMPKAAVCDALDQLCGCAENKQTENYRIRICSGVADGTFTKDKAMKMSTAALARIPGKSFKSFSDADLEAILPKLKAGIKKMRKKRDRGKARQISHALAKKAKKVGNLLDMSGREIAKRMRTKRFMELAKSEGSLKEILKTNDSNTQLPDGVKQRIWKEQFVNSPPEGITPENLNDIKAALSEIPVDEITKLNPDFRPEILKILCEVGGWDGRKPYALANLTREVMKDLQDDNTTHSMVALTTGMADDMNEGCLIGLGGEDISNTETSGEVCKIICSKIGMAPKLSCMTGRIHRQNLAKACLTCLRGTDVNPCESVDLTEEELDVLGQLTKDLSCDRADGQQGLGIDRIPALTLKSMARDRWIRNRKCLPADVRNAIDKKVCPTVTKQDLPEDIGLLAVRCFDQVDQTLVAENSEDVIEDLLPYDEEEEEEEACCLAELTDEQMKEVIQDEDSLALNFISMVQGAPDINRRKRATNPLTCVEVQSLGASASYLTVSQIQSMAADEFYNCYSTFGDIEGWSNEQAAELYSRFLVAIGSSICSASIVQLQDMGTIGIAMSTADINCLANLDSDTAALLGALDKWSKEQLTAWANKYKSSNSITDGSMITDEDLVGMQHFVCGLSHEDIIKISPVEYDEASAAIKELDKCSVDVLVDLAGLAKHVNSYGPVAYWDSATFLDVGIVLGGLSGSDLSQVPLEAIEGFSNNGVRHIPGSALKMMSESQLEAFSVEQASAVSFDALSKLSDSQRQALLKAKIAAQDLNIQLPSKASKGVWGIGFLTVLLEWLVCLLI